MTSRSTPRSMTSSSSPFGSSSCGRIRFNRTAIRPAIKTVHHMSTLFTQNDSTSSLLTRCAQHDGDAVKEALEPLVIRANAIEEVREEVGNQNIAEPERERRSEHKAVAPRETVIRKHAHARDGDRREEERRHATKNRIRDCTRTSEFRQAQKRNGERTHSRGRRQISCQGRQRV